MSDEIFNEWSWRSRNTIPTDLALLRTTARTYETLTVTNGGVWPVVDQVREHEVAKTLSPKRGPTHTRTASLRAAMRRQSVCKGYWYRASRETVAFARIKTRGNRAGNWTPLNMKQKVGEVASDRYNSWWRMGLGD